ncbi:MAG: glycerol-3-phosphate dehydrogenase [Undibacterium sp.]|nr:glycerol-3-phosphate dehydrogenase [Undibacterium sp.]
MSHDASQHASQEQHHLRCDLLIVGGGINGVGIARDAVGRGLSVVLCEKDDLAAHTSSSSSKLIHGGLRYLEYYEFALVRKALIEREILMRIAPHIITPIRFVMPHVAGLRPRWLLRLALFLYDNLAPRELLPGTESIRFSKHETGAALNSSLTHGFMYSDAWVDDARLVVLNAIDAKERGAKILTHTECDSLEQKNGRWLARLRRHVPHASGESDEDNILVDAAMVVNATGSWVEQFQHRLLPAIASAPTITAAKSSTALPPIPPGTQKKLRLIKGSHIVVPRLFEHEHAYIFQHPDGRVIFASPFQGAFTLIGTTDSEFVGNLDEMAISEVEVDYLCSLSNHYFAKQISAKDVRWSYAGVRPLVDDGNQDAKAITRDYHLQLVTEGAPILHVFGGKITTYRRLAEDVLALIAPVLACSESSWTAHACLPGGDLAGMSPQEQDGQCLAHFVQQCRERYSWLPDQLLQRFARSYGTRIHRLLADCVDLESLGECILDDLYEQEVRYLITHEFAQTAQDILWRRSKLGLHMAADAHIRLDAWIRSQIVSAGGSSP